MPSEHPIPSQIRQDSLYGRGNGRQHKILIQFPENCVMSKNILSLGSMPKGAPKICQYIKIRQYIMTFYLSQNFTKVLSFYDNTLSFYNSTSRFEC